MWPLTSISDRNKHASGKEEGVSTRSFTLRNIFEQCMERNNFFVSTSLISRRHSTAYIVHDSLWKLLRSCGLPQKIVTLKSKFYEHFLLQLHSQQFTVRMVHGWIWSPCGMQWSLFSYFEDLDFAEDLAILSSIYRRKPTDWTTMPSKHRQCTSTPHALAPHYKRKGNLYLRKLHISVQHHYFRQRWEQHQ